jgi:hypothetical protein
MASIIERLSEGVVNRDMRAESNALLTKWERTGLLEGLTNDRKKASMARLLENQAKELLRESSAMSAGDVEGFAAVAFPIVRRVFAGLIANDLVSVQPMSLPSGLIFFLDFVFSPNRGDSTQLSRFGNVVEKSIYGTDRVGSEITGGVNLIDSTFKSDESGPRTSARGYAYASPTGSSSDCTSGLANASVSATFNLDGDLTDNSKKLIEFDPDLVELTSGGIIVLDVAESLFSEPDFDNLSAFALVDLANQADTTGLAADLNASANVTVSAVTNIRQVRRLTTRVASDTRGAPFQSGLTNQAKAVRFIIVSDESQTESETAVVVGATLPVGTSEYPLRDNFDASTAVGSVVGAAVWGLENQTEIPEIDIKVDSIAVTAQTKKLKAKWTPELGQDLNAYHNLDAETELTSILSEQIALEIDREILADLVNGATAGTFYWSRAPGLFVNRETGAELGAAAAAPDFTGTVSEWYETLVETINDISAQIHRKTLRGGANFVVCGPEIANVLEFTAGFRASVTADDETGSIGAVAVGSLSKKFDVIVDPYFLRNVLLVGRRGASFLESGYVYAPYVPLQTTPTIFGPEDFVPRKGVMTRYAKKMVRPDMYGLVIVRGLLGESGAS